MSHDNSGRRHTSQWIRNAALQLGFDMVGIAPVQASEFAAYYESWLAADRHGAMSYLARPDAVALRLRPQEAWPQLRSAVVVALNYYTASVTADPRRGIVARYARGRDYHKVMKAKLRRLLEEIEQHVGHELPAARAYVDTGPVLERELARRAGLGWFGRNTMLVNPERGSYFFLGSLLLELELEPDAPFSENRCGTCAACVSACPTGALLGRNDEGAPMIDATRCISYLTIEQRGIIPRALRPLIGAHIFGCDICQDVCPWNQPKFVQLTGEKDFAPRHGIVSRELTDLLLMSYAEWDGLTRGSPVRRAGYEGWLRNVAVALGNVGGADAVAALSFTLAHASPLVRGHAAWSLGRIGSAEARAAIAAQLVIESDAWVVDELHAALEELPHAESDAAGTAASTRA